MKIFCYVGQRGSPHLRLCYCHRCNKREVSLTPWGESYYLSVAVSQHKAAAVQYYIANAHKKWLSGSCLQEILLLVVWWPCLNHPDMAHNSNVEEGTVFFYKVNSSTSSGITCSCWHLEGLLLPRKLLNIE